MCESFVLDNIYDDINNNINKKESLKSKKPNKNDYNNYNNDNNDSDYIDIEVVSLVG